MSNPAEVNAPGPAGVVFLLDVDNTLLDNDLVQVDVRRRLEQTCGIECGDRYWQIFEELRAELGYADYLGALQRYRLEHPRDAHVLPQVSLFLVDYPFARRLFPGAMDAVRRLRERGRVVILSDGDVVFQPRKVQRSGLWEAVGGHVLIYVHKEQRLDEVERLYPARHYVLVDDKRRLLAAVKRAWGDRVTTVFVRQGHYALDTPAVEYRPAADVTIERIADLLRALKDLPPDGRAGRLPGP